MPQNLSFFNLSAHLLLLPLWPLWRKPYRCHTRYASRACSWAAAVGASVRKGSSDRQLWRTNAQSSWLISHVDKDSFDFDQNLQHTLLWHLFLSWYVETNTMQHNYHTIYQPYIVTHLHFLLKGQYHPHIVCYLVNSIIFYTYGCF